MEAGGRRGGPRKKYHTEMSKWLNAKKLNKKIMNGVFRAAGKGDVEYLKNYIETKNVCIDATNRKGLSALLKAVYRGELERLKTLISAGADINIVRYENQEVSTPVMIAVKKGRFTCLEVLIKAGASPFLYNAEQCLEFPRNEDDVRMLVEAGANPKEIIQGLENEKCMNYLCENNSLEQGLFIHFLVHDHHLAVKAMIQAGTDVNIHIYSGKTAIMMVIYKQNLTLFQFLVDKCDLDIQDKDGMTALHCACEKCYPVTELKGIFVTTLLQAGANVNIQDIHGQTALMYAILKADRLNHYSDGQQYTSGECLCDCMIDFQYSVNIDAIENLINYKADLNIQDKDGKTALMHAVSIKQFKCAKTLILAGADTELKDKLNRTALSYLLRLHANDDFYDTLQFFFKTGVSPVIDPCHRKLFHCTQCTTFTLERIILEGQAELTRLLVCNGVVTECFDSGSEYKCALGCALHCRHYGVLKWCKSALGCALHCRQYGVVKYFFANCYLTLKDISDWRQRFKSQTFKLDMSDEEVDMDIIITQAVCQPWPLVKLAFIAVSIALGPGPDRQTRVTQTQLPDRLQRMLMFQEPVSRLPVSEWEDIPLTFDPVEYEKLPKPRPLLYYWPMGRNLVV